MDTRDYKDSDVTLGAPVLGQLGRQPDWLQSDESPYCPSCGRAMDFAVQLEDDRETTGHPLFGSGCAYVFTCVRCAEAVFLSQC
ncbi:hypothetical protein ACFV2S_16225 [Streptomyces sp. NPDC059695]|uniref:hypothetical protein n=1 Tax=Streptomyces sp. NPDC059695 TaxID=3346910 RepID=UPI0036B3C276